MGPLPSDVFAVCPEHGPRPDPRFLEKKPSWFIGKFVKVGYPIPNTKAQEFVWIKIIRCKNTVLIGFVDGVDYAKLQNGQRVSVQIDQICDVLNNKKALKQQKGPSCKRSLSKTGRLLSGSVCVTVPTGTVSAQPAFTSATPPAPVPRG